MSKHFLDAAKRAFSFLEAAGFRLTKSELNELQYDGTRSYVTVSWDARSGELEACIGLLSRTNQAHDVYTIADILSMEGALGPDRNLYIQVADEDRLGPFVEKLAEEVRTHARLALAGDRMYFRRLETFRHSQAEAYMRRIKLQRVRVEVEKAWHARQFDRVVSLYEPFENDLSESESLKLQYARRHLPSG